MGEEQYRQNYIQYDALCPMPRLGPRVVVGFWALDDIPYGTRPEVEGEPMFTITYPIGNGEFAFSWKHVDPFDEKHPIHPNSATDIEWSNGFMSFDQWVEFGGRPKLTKKDRAPVEKTAHWVLSRDMPDYLFGKIMATYELEDFAIREETRFRLCAPDGHYLGYAPEDAKVLCADRLIHDRNYFTAYFPNFKWDEGGGENDEGAFGLMAANGRFVRVQHDANGRTAIHADADTLADATLFEAEITADAMVAIQTEWDGQTVYLQHDPPHGALSLVADPDETWVWFQAHYA